MAYVDQQLDGFNPLKALGRALGKTGRVIAGTVANAAVPGSGIFVTGALEAGSKMPAPKPKTPKPGPSGNAATGADSSTLVSGGSTGNAILDQINAAIAKIGQPNIAPTPVPGPSIPPYQQQAASSNQFGSAQPAWLIPAAIGGVGLMLFMSMQKR